MSKIKPCPFCNEKIPTIEERNGTYYYKYRVICKSCGKHTHWFHYKSIAVSEWNKRKYVLVSQGIKIAEFYNKEEAEAIANQENEKYYKYVQECFDKGEPCGDTEIFIYEEAYGEIDESEGENEFQI